ncbi:hypothetical protein [uncultured Tateyamaria sp.]|uniref:hypothetical protein n=1 Tax=uncultured Tateyamaria sp. TaxID=455651 RepID=UPI0026283149|nr:hypothetical protein [uncultured Tateyamaria sp.]
MSRNLVDRANEALLATLRAGNPERFKDLEAADLRAQTRDTFEATRLPLISVPDLGFGQRARLSFLGFPNIEQMVALMAPITRDTMVVTWATIGQAWRAPEMDAHLGDHPHAPLGSALKQVAQSCFQPEHWVEFETYFKHPNLKGTYDAARVTRVYTIFAYLYGTERAAQKISRIVPMGPDLDTLRCDIMAAKTRFDAQSAQVDQDIADLKAHRLSGSEGAHPDWQDYLTTRA